jgi:hypothetical protein
LFLQNLFYSWRIYMKNRVFQCVVSVGVLLGAALQGADAGGHKINRRRKNEKSAFILAAVHAHQIAKMTGHEPGARSCLMTLSMFESYVKGQSTGGPQTAALLNDYTDVFNKYINNYQGRQREEQEQQRADQLYDKREKARAAAARKSVGRVYGNRLDPLLGAAAVDEAKVAPQPPIRLEEADPAVIGLLAAQAEKREQGEKNQRQAFAEHFRRVGPNAISQQEARDVWDNRKELGLSRAEISQLHLRRNNQMV